MTRFQRGETMEGWNDCPVPNAPTRLGTHAKSRKRLSHLQPNPSAPASKTQGNMPPVPPLSSKPPIHSNPQTEALGATESGSRSTVSKSGEESTVMESDNTVTEADLRELCQSEKLSDADRAFFAKRLLEPYQSLSDEHKNFIATIVQGVKTGEKASQLKALILKHMMIHNGVSTWCVSLKKLVEVS